MKRLGHMVWLPLGREKGRGCPLNPLLSSPCLGFFKDWLCGAASPGREDIVPPIRPSALPGVSFCAAWCGTAGAEVWRPSLQ